MKIDLETEDLAIIDESRCQNTTNTARRFCNPTINGVRDPNRLIKNWRKIWSKWCWFSRNQLFIGYFLQSEK